jgi:cytochrome c peroxidase
MFQENSKEKLSFLHLKMIFNLLLNLPIKTSQRGSMIKLYILLSFFVISCAPQDAVLTDDLETENQGLNLNKINLGESLFSDQNLSLNRTMSCATCHNPDHAFIDDRLNSVSGAVSIGQDGSSHGDRNSPTVTYAKFIPEFNQVGSDYFGGQFYDGRASNLAEQAKGPLLDSAEMQMPSKESVIQRVMESDEYVNSFKAIYGEDILDNTELAYSAVSDAIAEFEKSDSISPFDSRFDKNQLSTQELRGQNLFRGKANCVRCHDDRDANNVFSAFGYHNIGVPENTAVRAINNHATDQGLFQNPNVTSNSKKGRFRISTLRNVAVTSPYMHNGIFKDLKTVVHFYNTRDVSGALNPETGLPWEASEVPAGVVTQNVGNLGLTDSEEDDIVAFLRSLTDSKYEHLD